MKTFYAAMIVALLACTVGAAHATTVVAMDFDELVDKSALVVLCQPRSIDAFWQGPKVYTLARVDILATYKGPAGLTSVDVVTLGGRVNDIAQRVDGAATFAVGQTLVLHLRPSPSQTGEYAVVGWAQGEWFVRHADDTSPAPDSPIERPGIDVMVPRGPAPHPAGFPSTLGALAQRIAERARGR